MTRRVVVVDDEEDIREVAAMALEELWEWEVVLVASGAEAVGVVRDTHPDAVLLDVMMPGQDGPTTFAALRADAATRDVPVIFLTAKTQERDRARLAELGAAGVLAKPFDPMSIGDDVADLLGWNG